MVVTTPTRCTKRRTTTIWISTLSRHTGHLRDKLDICPMARRVLVSIISEEEVLTRGLVPDFLPLYSHCFVFLAKRLHNHAMSSISPQRYSRDVKICWYSYLSPYVYFWIFVLSWASEQIMDDRPMDDTPLTSQRLWYAQWASFILLLLATVYLREYHKGISSDPQEATRSDILLYIHREATRKCVCVHFWTWTWWAYYCPLPILFLPCEFYEIVLLFHSLPSLQAAFVLVVGFSFACRAAVEWSTTAPSFFDCPAVIKAHRLGLDVTQLSYELYDWDMPEETKDRTWDSISSPGVKQP